MSHESIHRYRIRADEVNLHRELTIPGLMQVMHESAWFNSKELGASVYDLHREGITWAMISYRLNVYHVPKHEEEIVVSSYPAGHARTFVYRDYHAETVDGRKVATASSTWLVLDLETRRMTRLRDYMYPMINLPAAKVALPRAARKLPQLEKVDGQEAFSVRWHELDPNGHATNSVYLLWALESLPHEFLASHHLREMQLSIGAETQAGQQVVAQWAAPNPLQRQHLIQRVGSDRPVAVAVSDWVRREE